MTENEIAANARCPSRLHHTPCQPASGVVSLLCVFASLREKNSGESRATYVAHHSKSKRALLFLRGP